jgi:hypothetical protein
MRRKRSIAADMGLVELRQVYLDAGRELADHHQDKKLLQDMNALWEELTQVLIPISALPSDYIVIPDDWPDRPAEERQHYMHAQLILNFSRDYTDSGWKILQNAVNQADNFRQYFQDRTAAIEKMESSKQKLEGKATDGKIKDLEARLEDLHRRQAEMHLRKSEGRPLDDDRYELDRITREITGAEALLQANKALRKFVYNPRIASIPFNFDLDALKNMRHELRQARKDRRSVTIRRLVRGIERWGAMAAVATLIFFLGKLSDNFLAWPLASGAALVLWLADMMLLEPFLQRRDAKRMRRGLLADARRMHLHKNNIRIQQAGYNQRLREAGMDEVVLLPVVPQDPIEKWIQDVIRGALSSSPT